MLKIIYLYLVYVFTHRMFVEYGFLPDSAKWMVDMFSIALIPTILVKFAIKKRFSARPGYLYIFLMTLVVVAVSAVVNQSSASALILGFRHHFKYLPFFMLPLVHDFSEGEIRKIFMLLCGISLLQFPVTLLQRFVWFSHVTTGDVVGGTVGSSGVISVILVLAITIIYSSFLAKHITRGKMLLLSALMFIPTTINETKATLILLPMSLIITTLLFGDKNILLKFKKIFFYSLVIMVLSASFIYIYDVLYGSKFQRSFIDYIVQEKEGRGYLYYGDERATERIEEGYRIGRIDSITMAFKNISKDTGRLFFGIGVGNALTSKIAFLKTSNEEIQEFFPDMTTIANVLWELGIIGLILQGTLLYFIFSDAFVMRVNKDFIGDLCLGWCSVVCIMIMVLFYLNIFHADALNTTFWLLSGIVVSKSYQFKTKTQGLR
ncbi:MAG: hypothetical protein HKM93_13295 [Desulfobacteraceae bacterium]|nr:hypothetical protein [Desulfobacteraceae bacterium]